MQPQIKIKMTVKKPTKPGMYIHYAGNIVVLCEIIVEDGELLYKPTQNCFSHRLKDIDADTLWSHRLMLE